MVFVKKETAMTAKGKLKEGYKCIKDARGRDVYMAVGQKHHEHMGKRDKGMEEEMKGEMKEKKKRAPRKKKAMAEAVKVTE